MTFNNQTGIKNRLPNVPETPILIEKVSLQSSS